LPKLLQLRGADFMCRMTFKAMATAVLCGWALMLSAPVLRAAVKLPNLLSDGMVLQQGMNVNIWGTAEPGESVSVSFQGQKVSGVAGAGGEWKVKLEPLHAGGPFTMTIAGNNTITLHDVLVGEVWVCSGQSNMEMALVAFAPWSKGVTNYEDEIAHSDNPNLRMFAVEKVVATRPQNDVNGSWVAAGPQTVSSWSAVAYFFGRDLQRTLNVPIGLINSSWGGTPAESWTSRGALESDPEFQSILDSSTKLASTYPKLFDDFSRQLVQWRQDSDKAESEGAPVPTPPTIPDDPRRSPWRASGPFNAMIMPLTRYSIRGAIWYQGESNSDRPVQYRKLFPALIRDWRRVWGEGDFPFLFVQLANWGIYAPGMNWPELREAQLKTLSLPNTGMAVTIDIGDGSDIHFRDKQDVGYRLALAAQAIAYGRDVMYSGPIYQSMAVEDDKIRLHFKYVYSGLVAKTLYTPGLLGFEIAGDDHKFVPGEAKVDGATVVVRSESVPHPVAVRYAWAANPWCNLNNSAGLPASPFRTDDWEETTTNK
jgi:sialate O-acetylesterase